MTTALVAHYTIHTSLFRYLTVAKTTATQQKVANTAKIKLANTVFIYSGCIMTAHAGTT